MAQLLLRLQSLSTVLEILVKLGRLVTQDITTQYAQHVLGYGCQLDLQSDLFVYMEALQGGEKDLLVYLLLHFHHQKGGQTPLSLTSHVLLGHMKPEKMGKGPPFQSQQRGGREARYLVMHL